MAASGSLKALQDIVGQAARKTGTIGLLKDLLDDQIIDDEGVALGANTTKWRDIFVHLDSLGELGQRISQDTDLSVSSTLLSPSSGDESIIHGYTGNNIIAL